MARENPERVGREARQDTLQLVQEGRKHYLYAIDEDDGENAEESTENEEDLQACCLLEKKRKWTVAGGDQQTEQAKGEEGQSSVTVECGEQSQF